MSLFSFLKSLVKVSDSNNYDTKQDYQILNSDFNLMITAVKSYKGTPKKVFIRVKGVKTSYYVTDAKYLALKTGWDAFVQMNKREPNFITINKTVTKPSPIPELETALGCTINDVQSWIQCLINVGVYSHYNCMRYLTTAFLSQYGLKVPIQRIRNGGLNCADYVAITIKVIEALKKMGLDISWEIIHVECNNSNGKPDPNAGHFLLKVTINGVTEYCDPAEAASGKRGLGHNMCYYNFNEDGIIGHTLC
jgi:hypothetical protein